MCLRFVYALVVRIVPALRLWRRGDDDKTVEILLLRHQLAVLQRQLAAAGKRPRPDWADRAIRTLVWNHEHLCRILREYKVHHNTHRPHMGLSAAAPLKPLPPNVTDLDAFRVQRTRRTDGVINEYRPAA